MSRQCWNCRSCPPLQARRCPWPPRCPPRPPRPGQTLQGQTDPELMLGSPRPNPGVIPGFPRFFPGFPPVSPRTGALQGHLHGVGDLLLLAHGAQLALKHRQGKNHKMRIIAFVGSPVHDSDKDLVKLAKRLKKEKVNVDIINFGEEVRAPGMAAFQREILGMRAGLEGNKVDLGAGLCGVVGAPFARSSYNK
uniref:VWFA domain-containing protein n=1 Tax=Junco hyemalis TaxID=40217 RepID=A0A8C5NJM2_JUNHY